MKLHSYACLCVLVALPQTAYAQVGRAPASPVPRSVRDAWSEPITWRAPDGFYAAPAHATSMPDGRILFIGFERDTEDPLAATQTRPSAFIFTPTPHGAALPQEVEIVNETEPVDVVNGFFPPYFVNDDLFCSGNTLLANGSYFSAGGTRGIIDVGTGDVFVTGLSYSTVYDGNTWSRVPGNMSVIGSLGDPVRWYPSCTRIWDGRILVTSGYDLVVPAPLYNLSAEIFDPATGAWSVASPFGEPPVEITNADYTHPIVLPEPVGGFDLVMLGGAGIPVYFSLDGPVRWSSSGSPRPGSLPSETPNRGATSLPLPIRLRNGEWGYRNGSVLVAGGDHDTLHQAHADVFDAAQNTWLPRVKMHVLRHHPTSVLLPDGRALIVAGHNEEGDVNVQRASYVDPAHGFEHRLGSSRASEVRGYHNVVALLADGRVLVGGGRDSETAASGEKSSFRYYYPSYLFATRPVIDSAPTELDFAQPFSVTTSIRRPVEFCLMALGSMTHSFDFNQRQIQLAVNSSVRTGPGQFRSELVAPPDGRYAPPGYYFLFAIDKNRVPSEGIVVHVD